VHITGGQVPVIGGTCVHLQGDQGPIRGVLSVTKTAQVEPRSGRVEAPYTRPLFGLDVCTFCGMCWVVSWGFVKKMAQVKVRSGRVEAPAVVARLTAGVFFAASILRSPNSRG
jgi:hypothetical protein